ncbi:MAG: hypothetical protein QOE14_754 [Humisphaera sp.]|nr:hypothetical protein [Humisphaera sp.]
MRAARASSSASTCNSTGSATISVVPRDLTACLRPGHHSSAPGIKVGHAPADFGVPRLLGVRIRWTVDALIQRVGNFKPFRVAQLQSLGDNALLIRHTSYSTANRERGNLKIVTFAVRFRRKATHMSWDAILLRIKGKPRPIEEVDDDQYLPLGSRKDVLAAIMVAFPEAKWETPTQLFHHDGDVSIEFVLQGRNPVDSVTLEVRGEGDPITPILKLAKSNRWVVLDTSTSEFMDPGDPSPEGYEGYRKLVRGVEKKKPPKRRKKK